MRGLISAALKRDPEKVKADVEDDYVSVERARTDYGVVIKVIDEDLAEYEVDEEATCKARETIAAKRCGWLREDPESVAQRFRDGEIDLYDVIRRYGVICNWGTGELLPNSTRDFRAAMERRSAAHWA